MVIQKWLNFITGQNLRLNFWTALLGAATSQMGKGGGDANSPQAMAAKQQQQMAQQSQVEGLMRQPSPMPQPNGMQVPTGQNYSPLGIQAQPPQNSGAGFAQFLQQQTQNYDKGGLFGMLAQLMGGNKNG